MELKLTGSTGVPDGSLVSIKIGSIRRQAAVGSGRPYRFPEIMEGKQHMKVDVFAPVAHARLLIEPGEAKCSVQLEGPLSNALNKGKLLGVQDMGLDFAMSGSLSEKDNMLSDNDIISVQESRPNSAASVTSERNAARRHQVALEAQPYFDQHHLMEVMQILLQSVIKDKPSDPYSYMIGVLENSRNAQKGAAAEARLPEKIATPTKPSEPAQVSRQRPSSAQARTRPGPKQLPSALRPSSSRTPGSRPNKPERVSWSTQPASPDGKPTSPAQLSSMAATDPGPCSNVKDDTLLPSELSTKLDGAREESTSQPNASPAGNDDAGCPVGSNAADASTADTVAPQGADQSSPGKIDLEDDILIDSSRTEEEVLSSALAKAAGEKQPVRVEEDRITAVEAGGQAPAEDAIPTGSAAGGAPDEINLQTGAEGDEAVAQVPATSSTSPGPANQASSEAAQEVAASAAAPTNEAVSCATSIADGSTAAAVLAAESTTALAITESSTSKTEDVQAAGPSTLVEQGTPAEAAAADTAECTSASPAAEQGQQKVFGAIGSDPEKIRLFVQAQFLERASKGSLANLLNALEPTPRSSPQGSVVEDEEPPPPLQLEKKESGQKEELPDLCGNGPSKSKLEKSKTRMSMAADIDSDDDYLQKLKDLDDELEAAEARDSEEQAEKAESLDIRAQIERTLQHAVDIGSLDKAVSSAMKAANPEPPTPKAPPSTPHHSKSNAQACMDSAAEPAQQDASNAGKATEQSNGATDGNPPGDDGLETLRLQLRQAITQATEQTTLQDLLAKAWEAAEQESHERAPNHEGVLAGKVAAQRPSAEPMTKPSADEAVPSPVQDQSSLDPLQFSATSSFFQSEQRSGDAWVSEVDALRSETVALRDRTAKLETMLMQLLNEKEPAAPLP